MTEKGDVYVMEPWERQKEGTPSLANRDYFQSILKTGKTSWSDVNISSSDGSALATVGVPIKDKSGKLQAVLTGSLQFSVLNETASRVDLGHEDAVMLFDSGAPPARPGLVPGVSLAGRTSGAARQLTVGSWALSHESWGPGHYPA